MLRLLGFTFFDMSFGFVKGFRLDVCYKVKELSHCHQYFLQKLYVIVNQENLEKDFEHQFASSLHLGLAPWLPCLICACSCALGRLSM